MKHNWVSIATQNTTKEEKMELIEKIQDLILWYEENSTRKEDDYIKANLKLVIHLAENVEHSEDLMFIEKITETFCDIIKKQREVIQVLEYEADFQPINSVAPNNYVSSYASPIGGFTSDEQIKSVFVNFMIHGKEKQRSSFTANDYVLRVQNLWRSFYADYEARKLPSELAESVIRDEIQQDAPLLNAYNYIEELNCYLSMKIAGESSNRNWLNVRAALNIFGEAMHGKEYEKVKVVRDVATSKDFSKYIFEGNTYGKSRLVLAVVKKYVDEHHPATFDELKKAFPDSLQGSLGVVRRIEDVSEKYKGNGGVKRYFVKADEIIQLPSSELVIVCTQWGITNTEQLIKHVAKYGYQISQI